MVLARKHRPDLICLDIMMPKRTGIALYEDFKSDPDLKAIPVIFVSAFSQVHDMKLPEYFHKVVSERAEIPDPEAYVEKPIKPTEFIDIVASVIGASFTGEK